MSWNYRLVRHRDPGGEILAIHEVYYNDDGVPTSVTVDPVGVVGDDLAEIEATLDLMRRACGAPILEYSIFGVNEPSADRMDLVTSAVTPGSTRSG